MNPDLLSQLRDIHAAPAVSWWPPAPGWWVLALVVVVALIWLARRGLVRFRVRQRRRQMLAWIDHLNTSTDAQREPQAYLSTLNRIFKLVALRAFPERRCAVMAGQEWVEFLSSQMGDDSAAESLGVLAVGPYDPAPQFDAETLCELTRQWIRKHG